MFRLSALSIQKRAALALSGVLLAAVGTAILLRAIPADAATSGPKPTATYSRGVLSLTVPYQASRAGAGTLTLEVLDPDDAVLGHAQTAAQIATAGDGAWEARQVRLAKSLPVDELVWHRLRYRFTFNGAAAPEIEGIESISNVLRTPALHVLAQQSYAAGSAASVRLIAVDSKSGAPLAGPVRARVEFGDQRQVLFAGTLNERGTSSVPLRFPAGVAGAHTLRYLIDSPLGETELVQPVRLETKTSILLTTEKPLYQPGQTIHVRALVLDRASRQAAAARPLTLELEDPRGNKVFRKTAQTSKFGVASAEFTLADEVNLGAYHLRAATEGAMAERTLNVERYVLPKFKVAVEFTGKHQHGYRPGDTVTGIVRAHYFFGQPVDGSVSVKASGLDVAQFEAATAQGKTGPEGDYRFALKLPTYFAGKPLSGGAARVLIEATVKDSAAHAETRGMPVTVSESPLLITAVPEGGQMAPGMENEVYVLASYADGQPAPRTTVKVQGRQAETDESGVAVLRLPGADSDEPVLFEARDRDGNRSSAKLTLERRHGDAQILLRADRAVYRAGETMRFRVLSTKAKGAAYVDLVKDGQTMLTRDVDLENGTAELEVPVTPELAGTVDSTAYLFGPDATPVADHRLLFVHPADELRITATADAAAYRPGSEARVRFRVTNARGEGVQAALGVQVVDEAVFALAEAHPGFAKVFFYLEQEALKPRYEIHGVGAAELVSHNDEPLMAKQNRAAKALFAAAGTVNRHSFRGEAGRTVPQTKRAVYLQRYQERLSTQLRALRGHPERAKLRDPWNNQVKIERAQWMRGAENTFYSVRSAGMDKVLGTNDDLGAWIQARTRRGAVDGAATSIEVNIEHDRGAYRAQADVTGKALDASSEGVEGLRITMRRRSDGHSRTDRTMANGAFSLTGLPPGEYELSVWTDSAKVAAQTVRLASRDRAVVQIKVAGGVDVIEGPVDVRQMAFFGAENENRMRRFAPGAAGGVIGGIVGEVMMAAAPPPPPRMMRAEAVAMDKAVPKEEKAKASSAASAEQPGAGARVRSYFPEALYINPEIITAENGEASVVIPIADSITTWRMALMASTTRGALGSGTSSLKVFQEFFADLDLPVTLTQGDKVSIPVAAYNYAGADGDVALRLEPADWYSLAEGDTADKRVAVANGRVGGAQFTVEARRIGKFQLKLAASLSGTKFSDIVVREIEVVPNGREQNLVVNGRLEPAAPAEHDIAFPAQSIADASKIYVRLYPGPLSQVVEGMDAILRMPYGCFEQTSSATYPNVLALDYLKRSKKLTPEVRAKAEGFIVNGYQRLLTYEVPGGGFSWFGNPPANKILTSYGLMEFFDMAKVHDVDPRVIERTQAWLAAQQKPDGSWAPDQQFINEGATNRYNTNVTRITAYVAWALAVTGYRGPAVDKARQYVEAHMNDKHDNYTLAVLANFAVASRDRAFAQRALELLVAAREEKGEHVWWNAEETAVYATGTSAAVETTGLAVQALLAHGQHPGVARKALAYVAAKKDASGTWGTTQATIMALKAILASFEKGAADVRGTVEITLNGTPVERLTLTADNNDLFHQFVLKNNVSAAGANRVGLRFTGGAGMLAYQVVGRSFLAWDQRPADEPMTIDVTYDRTRLAQDDVATATAVVKNNLPKTANMVMIDLGIPPGFDLLSEDLQAMQERTAGQKGGGRLEKFTQTATQAMLYFDSIPARGTVTVKYRLRAKYPLRARTPKSVAYEYYDPAVNSVARPILLEVARKR